MNTKSVRFRLTIWYSIAFFLATAVIFASFYLVTKQSLYNQTDTTITSHSEKIVDIITNKGTDMHQMMARQVFLQEFSDPGMVVILTDNSGNVIGSSFTVNRGDKAVSELFQAAKTSDKPIFMNEILGTTNLRFQTYPINQNGQLKGVILVGHPIDVIDKALTNLLLMLVVVFIVFVIPTVVGGYLLAQSAMQPITVISEQLKKISSKNLEERVIIPKTNDEIKELAITFNNLLDRLSQAFKRERQFIGDVAHELKTPLASQRSGLEVVIGKERTNEEYKKTIKEAITDNNRIATTLKNILDLAWSSAENTKSQAKTVNLSELVEEIYDLATKMAISKQITIKGTIGQNIKILGTRDKLFRAFLNIIDNAIKYTQEKGKLSIILTTTPTLIRFQVKDNGYGIAREDLPHIFERFYRGSKADKTFGSGLGLSITQAIIIVHQGKIDVESIVGKGTTVIVSFPRL